jgi:hypothetical protein
LRLAAGIKAEGSAGDEIEATLVRAVRDRQGRTLPPGTLFRGHITRFEKVHDLKHAGAIVSLRLDTIVLDGKLAPIGLNPVERTDNRGDAVFSFPGTHAVVGQGLVSRWRVL